LPEKADQDGISACGGDFSETISGTPFGIKGQRPLVVIVDPGEIYVENPHFFNPLEFPCQLFDGFSRGARWGFLDCLQLR
jgi:hypothetical protein